MFIDTEAKSSAVDAIVLPLTSRNVQVAWQSGSVASYVIRRRDQLRFLALRLRLAISLDEEISYGGFANWCKEECEWNYV